jgi:hypothetical protein
MKFVPIGIQGLFASARKNGGPDANMKACIDA